MTGDERTGREGSTDGCVVTQSGRAGGRGTGEQGEPWMDGCVGHGQWVGGRWGGEE